MFRAILLVLLIAIAGFLAYVAMQPDTYTVSRTRMIAAQPATVFNEINTLKNWRAWSPWAKKDPNAKFTYAGPERGTGAKVSWSGGADVGTGTMTIRDVVDNERVDLAVKFVEPFESESDVSLALEPQGDETQVRWTINGPKPFLQRVILTATAVDFEQMIGNDFDAGLSSLKKVAEAKEAARIAAERKAAEEAARLEAERKAKEEAERKAKEEAARLEAERKAKEEAERQAAEEAARLEAERKAKEEAERKAAEEAARLEAERKAAEEAARVEAERKAKEEAERKAAEEAARLEAERKAAEAEAAAQAETASDAAAGGEAPAEAPAAQQ